MKMDSILISPPHLLYHAESFYRKSFIGVTCEDVSYSFKWQSKIGDRQPTLTPSIYRRYTWAFLLIHYHTPYSTAGKVEERIKEEV